MYRSVCPIGSASLENPDYAEHVSFPWTEKSANGLLSHLSSKCFWVTPMCHLAHSQYCVRAEAEKACDHSYRAHMMTTHESQA